jgi:hypothetical protein
MSHHVLEAPPHYLGALEVYFVALEEESAGQAGDFRCLPGP